MDPNALFNGLPGASYGSRPSGLSTTSAASGASGVPWGHVGSEAIAAVVAGAGAFVVGSGTVAIGGLMTTQPEIAPALVGVFVIGMSEAIGRGTEAAVHVQAAFQYATSDKPLAEVEAAVKQQTGTSVSPVGNVVATATGSKDAGKLAENYVGAAVGAMNTLSAGLAILASEVAAPAQKMLEQLDNKPNDANKAAPSTTAREPVVSANEKSEKKDEGERSGSQGDGGHYEPAPKPESEESNTTRSHM